MKAMTTCLWFDTEAEEAARFYTSVFEDSRLGLPVFEISIGAACLRSRCLEIGI